MLRCGDDSTDTNFCNTTTEVVVAGKARTPQTARGMFQLNSFRSYNLLFLLTCARIRISTPIRATRSSSCSSYVSLTKFNTFRETPWNWKSFLYDIPCLVRLDPSYHSVCQILSYSHCGNSGPGPLQGRLSLFEWPYFQWRGWHSREHMAYLNCVAQGRFKIGRAHV